MAKKKKTVSLTQDLSKNKNAREAAAGVINLAQADGALFKRALLCRTGIFDGMYGQAIVTQQLLEGIANRYNKERAKPQNENDYAPILKEHIRDADLIKGRVMANMSVEELEDPGTGDKVFGLFADLRIDDEDAKAKVEKGQYAHLSISFDEDTFEFYEVSFVAVEAARRSMVLSQQEKEKTTMDFKAKFNSLSQKKKALVAALGQQRLARKAALKKLSDEKAALETEAQALGAKAQELGVTMKSYQTKAQFAAFIRAGKMNPAELKEMDFKALAQMPEVALKALLSSYEKREVSTDVRQYGQTGEGVKGDEKLSTPEQVREAIKLQKSGKKTKALADEPAAPAADDKKAEAVSHSLSDEDYKAVMAEIGVISEKLSGVLSKIKAVGEQANEILAQDEKDEVEEKQLAADDESDPEKKEGE